MFSKKNKISRALFPKYTEKKNTWNGMCLRVCYYKKEIPQATLFAVVVSKKQYKTIVARNFFKRQVLSLLVKNKNVFFDAPFGKYIIYPKFLVETLDKEKITVDINEFINKCLI